MFGNLDVLHIEATSGNTHPTHVLEQCGGDAWMEAVAHIEWENERIECLVVALGVRLGQGPVDTAVLLRFSDAADLDLHTVNNEAVTLWLDDGLSGVHEV